MQEYPEGSKICGLSLGNQGKTCNTNQEKVMKYPHAHQVQPADSSTEPRSTMKKITILTTGGTIDKVYFDAKSEYEVGPPNIERVLGELNLAIAYTITSLMKKDSLEITAEDRGIIRQAAAAAATGYILITHGTDTMTQTAEALMGLAGKTIVLTGALEPALFKTSDAMFNIGCALGAVQSLPPGVYIAMNGAVFTAGQVRKNLALGRFEEIAPA